MALRIGGRSEETGSLTFQNDLSTALQHLTTVRAKYSLLQPGSSVRIRSNCSCLQLQNLSITVILRTPPWSGGLCTCSNQSHPRAHWNPCQQITGPPHSQRSWSDTGKLNLRDWACQQNEQKWELCLGPALQIHEVHLSGLSHAHIWNSSCKGIWEMQFSLPRLYSTESLLEGSGVNVEH